jgi:hypothetical protein
MANFLQDLGYGARMLLRNPGFAIIAILTIALGIGANTAIFSVVETALLRVSPPSRRLSVVWGVRRKEYSQRGFCSRLSGLSAEPGFRGTLLTPGQVAFFRTGEPQRVFAPAVGRFLQVLGVAPVLGRTFRRRRQARNSEQ